MGALWKQNITNELHCSSCMDLRTLPFSAWHPTSPSWNLIGKRADETFGSSGLFEQLRKKINFSPFCNVYIYSLLCNNLIQAEELTFGRPICLSLLEDYLPFPHCLPFLFCTSEKFIQQWLQCHLLAAWRLTSKKIVWFSESLLHQVKELQELCVCNSLRPWWQPVPGMQAFQFTQAAKWSYRWLHVHSHMMECNLELGLPHLN